MEQEASEQGQRPGDTHKIHLKPLPPEVISKILTSPGFKVTKSNRVQNFPAEHSQQVASSCVKEHTKKTPDSITTVPGSTSSGHLLNGEAQIETKQSFSSGTNSAELNVLTESVDSVAVDAKNLSPSIQRKSDQHAWPSDDQLRTFQQCALSCKDVQITLLVEVAELEKLGLITKDQEEHLYRLVHQRDPGIIRTIIEREEEERKQEDAERNLKEENELKAKKLKVALEKHICEHNHIRSECMDCGGSALAHLADVNPLLSYRLPFKRTMKRSSAHILQVPATSLGLEWKEAGSEKPSMGAEIYNELLAAALQKKVEFSKTEWENFQVADLSSGSYIKSGDRYFKPAGKEDLFNVHLVRYFVENVWKLEKPDVIISITGGAQNFDLPPEQKDRMMRGMMEGTRQIKPWSVSAFTSVFLFCPFVGA
jgi:hypothetical protein